MDKILLENKLREIAIIINSKSKSENNLGVLSGLSGISLFQFYYSKYLNVNDHANCGVEIISLCIDKINTGYTYPTFCTGMAGFGWTLDHLIEAEFLSTESDELLPIIDEYCYTIMISDMEKGYYDLLHGGIGYAFYFLQRYKSTQSDELRSKYKLYLLEFIKILKSLAHHGNDHTYKWFSEMKNKTNVRVCNLSLSHGMASIIGILTRLHNYDDFIIPTEQMLRGAVDYILSFQSNDSETLSLFPNWISEDGKHDGQSRLAWCYGDLGIAVQLWYAARTLNEKKMANKAIAILKHAAKRTSSENTMVIDAAICHGSFGNAHIFNRMFKETGLSVFKSAAMIWVQEGLNMANYEDGYAGYKQCSGIDCKWAPNLSLLEGISGIGLTLIDFLADSDNNWDECLMIS